ncbi:hypothetical protein GUITHDRAFT_137589 [Guillardia theta CCMP2712]|uniref:Uncharacterized protein n=1 Tax=Guillardia theta (strain CCMP2712) TaxID=905079 RepID=L1JH03_GUITC|nr:hypothetical protein GUITHDRAFT_137589 [Guillardia theta CCMP2712]EKX47424.1 hypothetical protein GUITHDRAFT_137589 [Guillardia theta CCMP2712]|eukprot:XP_005834404.1 hypothetical protein GUITHDRAFT_137589 [Guillardia theta CCMP2712]
MDSLVDFLGRNRQGACTRLAGEVWFSPEETSRILQFLGITEKAFKDKYVNKEMEGWNRVHRVRGDDHPTFTLVSPDADDEGSSVDSWNEHVVLTDEEAQNYDGEDKKVWTKKNGGCEGMKEVLSRDSNRNAHHDQDKMVSVDEIRKLLVDYEDTYCMFPEEPWKWFV